MNFIIILTLTSALAMPSEVALQEFTSGNNLFAAAIYKETLKEIEGNFLVSPFSISTVLAMTQSGAKDGTGEEIRIGLHLPNSSEKTESLYAALLSGLKGNNKYALYTANKIYVKNSYPLKENFTTIASNVYQSEVENVDFSQKEEAADTINNWVEQQTENKIHEIIDPKSLGDDTLLILMNALYFKGKWVYPFDSYSTIKKNFYKTAKDIVQVETMHNIDIFNYYESPELNAKFLELPYEGENISMVIVLPNEKEGLAALENQIEKVFTTPKFTQERVSVSLPKFTIENKLKLKEMLKNLGINKVFTEEADLSGIAGEKGELVVSDVVQKVFINVTETGTEAAAATAVKLEFHSGPSEQYEIKIFSASHPFIFYLTCKGIITFEGRITNPFYQ